MTIKCIRCDKKMEKRRDMRDREYKTVTYNHELGALPICRDCFDAVKGRDLWSR